MSPDEWADTIQRRLERRIDYVTWRVQAVTAEDDPFWIGSPTIYVTGRAVVRDKQLHLVQYISLRLLEEARGDIAGELARHMKAEWEKAITTEAKG